MASIGDWRALGGELKLAPPPPYPGSIEHWEEWLWQLKSYVSLFKPHIAKLLESAEGKSDLESIVCEVLIARQSTERELPEQDH